MTSIHVVAIGRCELFKSTSYTKTMNATRQSVAIYISNIIAPSTFYNLEATGQTGGTVTLFVCDQIFKSGAPSTVPPQ